MNSRDDGRRMADEGRRMCDGIAQLPVPVIAALPGPAIGGGAELAIACDLRVADPRARLSFKHARMAVTTAWGIMPKLVSMVGSGGAARLLLAGQDVDAAEALRMGLVEAVCEEGASLATAVAWARDVAKGAPEAIAALKTLLREGIDAPRARQRARERSLFVAAWAGADHHEAVEAFFGGRAPRWGCEGEEARPLSFYGFRTRSSANTRSSSRSTTCKLDPACSHDAVAASRSSAWSARTSASASRLDA